MIREPAVVPEMIALPSGHFEMGETPDDKFANDTERPARSVAMTRRFALGKFPVTVREYRAFAPHHAPNDDEATPVVNVTWDDARCFCDWLRARSGQPFRLPSEAEWEYACRAGSATCFSFGNELTIEQANFLYTEEGVRAGPGRRTPVGSYPANAFGLHDFHGNVCEWVEDAWHPTYVDAPLDPSAWVGNSRRSDRRAIRGGAWDYLPRLLRSSWRDALPRSAHRDNVGFRLALTLAS
jgi:formylglycine-generating enzyme required for sulfatase activity